MFGRVDQTWGEKKGTPSHGKLMPAAGSMGCCQRLFFLVDSLLDVGKNGIDGANAFDVDRDALFLVEVEHGLGLLLVDVEASLDGLHVIVGATRGLATLDEAVNEFVVGHLEVEANRNASLVLSEEFLEGCSLINCAREAIEDDAIDLTHLVDVGVDHTNDNVVGNEFAFIHV